MNEHATRGPGRHRAGDADRPGGRRGPRTAVTVAAAAAAVGATFSGPAGAIAATDDAPANPEATPSARAAHAEAQVPGTPCSVSADACVDLESQRAWLIEDGRVVRGPMRITSGARGHETPVGHSFRVYRHDADHVSRESRTRDGRPAPMPYSTFFADGGVAFHGGSLERASAGCVHMEASDAEAVFDELRNGDKVQVVNASQERAARAAS